MKWLEADSLPVVCPNCQKEDCYNCDYAGKRWYLSQEDELQIKRKSLIKAIERLQRQVLAIDQHLLLLTGQQKSASDDCAKMTYDLFLEYLEVCFLEGSMDKFFEVWNKHPEHIAKLKKRSQQEPYKSKEQERWAKLRAKLGEDLGEDWVKKHCID